VQCFRLFQIFLLLFSLSASAQSALAPGSLSGNKFEARVDKIISQMTLEEKVLQLLSYVPNGVPRLGIPSLHSGEALHGVLTKGATVFPQSIALGSTFDEPLLREIGVVIGQESRAGDALKRAMEKTHIWSRDSVSPTFRERKALAKTSSARITLSPRPARTRCGRSAALTPVDQRTRNPPNYDRGSQRRHPSASRPPASVSS
jgi:hypothetical protein